MSFTTSWTDSIVLPTINLCVYKYLYKVFSDYSLDRRLTCLSGVSLCLWMLSLHCKEDAVLDRLEELNSQCQDTRFNRFLTPENQQNQYLLAGYVCTVEGSMYSPNFFKEYSTFPCGLCHTIIYENVFFIMS